MSEHLAQQPLSRVELVVLARLARRTGATTAEIAKALTEIGIQLTDLALADCMTSALAALEARGLVVSPAKPAAKRGKTKKAPPPPRFNLTQRGQEALCTAFGVKATPTWAQVLASVVPALALGAQPGSAAAKRVLGSEPAMLATVLRRDPELGDLTSVAELCDRVVARALGMPPGPVTLAGIRAYVLAMHCGAGTKTELDDIASRFAPSRRLSAPNAERELKALATKLAGVDAKNRASLLKSLQRRWVSKQDEADAAHRPSGLRATPLQPTRPESHDTPPPSPGPAESLLHAVREAIPRVGSHGRYGKENVFVSALWQQVARDRRLPSLSLDGFKSWLVTANRNQLLELARADLIDDMDARMVEDSEISDLGATFHFVLDHRDPSAAPGQVHYGR